jgi:hypothetical protein
MYIVGERGYMEGGDGNTGQKKREEEEKEREAQQRARASAETAERAAVEIERVLSIMATLQSADAGMRTQI